MKLTSQTLDQALWLYRQGYVDEEEWNRYAHRWQTSAPRFALRACNCAECVKEYPSPEYRAP